MPITRAWSQPFTIARRDAGDYKAAWPTIIVYDNSLMVIYQDSNPATRWMRQSMDWGQTWTDPIRPWQLIGEYSQVDLLVDSLDRLHVVLGYRNGECCHGMWHGVWDGDQWGPLEPIVMGPKTPQFDPSAPQSIMSQGNVILATWWTDTGGGPRNGAWYSYTVLDAPELPHVALPTAGPASLNIQTPTPIYLPSDVPQPTLTATLEPLSTLGAGYTNPPPGDNPGMPVIIGIIPVALFVIGAIIWRKSTAGHQ